MATIDAEIRRLERAVIDSVMVHALATSCLPLTRRTMQDGLAEGGDASSGAWTRREMLHNLEPLGHVEQLLGQQWIVHLFAVWQEDPGRRSPPRSDARRARS